PEALDYVVAHEVAHLRHMNHGRHFWNLCRTLSEDFLEGQYWMQNYGQDLMRYGYGSID
ncbi:MAG: YgjP-like metallopeptidase domain-containing protein, partial [Alphaproteobacteria bacterium]